MDNWQTFNSTESSINEGHDLFVAVERWIYVFIVIDSAFIIGTFVITMSMCCDRKKYELINVS